VFSPYLAVSFTPTYFGISQARELSHRIREAENAVKTLVEEEAELTAQGHGRGSRHPNCSSSRATHDTEAQEAHGNDVDEGSDDDDEDDHSEEHNLEDIEEHFHLLEEEVANLVADVHDLALYTKLNVTGFMKILKVRGPHVKIFGGTESDSHHS
jgi:adenosine deaminase